MNDSDQVSKTTWTKEFGYNLLYLELEYSVNLSLVTRI